MPLVAVPTGDKTSASVGHIADHNAITDELRRLAAGGADTSALEDRITALELASSTSNIECVDFTGPAEPARPAVGAGIKVWWTGPFFPAAALVGDKVDLTA